MSEKINPGDICIITEIGENDHHSKNENLIGKRVMPVPGVPIFERNYFQSCFVEFLEDVPGDDFKLEKGDEIYFSEVKLMKCE